VLDVGLFGRKNAAGLFPVSTMYCGGMVIEMDRLNAIRLLQALIAAGKDSSAPMAKGWINKKAWEIGLERQELVSALGYAGNEGWIADGPREGWISLTSKGEAAARGK
jgi:hypothetical protein